MVICMESDLAKTLARFSALEVERLAASKGDKTRMHHDGGGLYLCVDRRGSANWVYRYTLDGRARTMGLGAFPKVGLSKARKAAAAARETHASRSDPLDKRQAEREAERAARRQKVTFKKAAKDYIASKRDEWKNPKHAAQWSATLETYAYGIIGDLAVSDVDNAAVLRVLQQEVSLADGKNRERLWTAKPETASRLRGRIEAVLGWATAGGLRVGDNPARWAGLLEHQLPSKAKLPRGRVKHHRALSIDDVPDFMEKLRAANGMGARALEFGILTAARSGEVRGATWAEVDLKARVWNIPGNRMKAGRDHRIPLSQAAMDLLAALPGGESDELIVPAPRGGVLSDMTLAAVIKRLNCDAVPHGFRSSFRDWGAERTNYPNEMLELALAHTVSDKVEAAYRRGDMFDKRRKLMDAWSEFCASKPRAAGDNVRSLRQKA